MPAKLKPIRDDKELLAIPVDEPVLVELEPQASGTEDEGVVEPEKPAKPAAKTKPEPGADDGVTALQTQMAEMQRANATENARLARERDDALRQADEARAQAADTEADLISNGLTSAQAEAKAARLALKSARDLGDVDAEADASERIARAAADVREFERAAAQVAERPKPEPVQQRVEPTDAISVIDRMQLLPAEAAWLKTHTELVTDPRLRRKLDVAFDESVEKKLVRGTQAYFDHMDEFMGYTKPAAGRDDDRGEERTVMTAAPVSRDNRSVATGRATTPTRIELSPAERQVARDMGISDTAYARGKLQLAANKAADPEKYARTA